MRNWNTTANDFGGIQHLTHFQSISRHDGHEVFLRHAFVKTRLITTVCIDFWWPSLRIKTIHPSERSASVLSSMHLWIPSHHPSQVHLATENIWRQGNEYQILFLSYLPTYRKLNNMFNILSPSWTMIPNIVYNQNSNHPLAFNKLIKI